MQITASLSKKLPMPSELMQQNRASFSPEAMILHQTQQDRASFGCTSDDHDHSHAEETTFTEPEKTYTKKERILSRLKLNKLSLNPFRLEGTLFWSIALGAFSGFALTPALLLAGVLACVIAGWLIPKPVDLEKKTNTLLPSQTAYKAKHAPTIKALGQAYKTLGDIAEAYTNQRQVKFTGEHLQTLDLGIDAEQFQSNVTLLFNLLNASSHNQQATQSLKPDTTVTNDLTKALELSSQLLNNTLPLNTQQQTILTIHPTTNNSTEAYTQLKKHRQALISLIQLGQTILELPETSQPIDFDQNTTLPKSTDLATFINSLPQLNDQQTITDDVFSEVLNEYKTTLEENDALLKNTGVLIKTFLNNAKTALFDDAKALYDFHTTIQTIITSNPKTTT